VIILRAQFCYNMRYSNADITSSQHYYQRTSQERMMEGTECKVTQFFNTTSADIVRFSSIDISYSESILIVP
jgi:hypothetical protein